MNKIFVLFSCMVLMVLPLGARAAITPPDVLIKNIAQDVLSIVKQDKNILTDKKKILALVDAKVLPNFDFRRMTREAAGKNWRIADPDQRKKLVVEFQKLLVNTYTNTFTRYRDQTVEVMPLQVQKGANEVTVRTSIVQPGSEAVQVDYEMEKTANGWKAFDLTVDGVSLDINYRSTFDELVEQSGVDGLIKTLADKNAANNVSQ
jgi:phospholipid transport system substrate-binding protein